MKMLLPVIMAVGVAFPVTLRAQASPQTAPDKASPSLQQDSQPASLGSSLNKGDRKIAGCLRAENGKFVVASGHNQKIWLSGPQDFASHVGHSVVLYGTFLSTDVSQSAARSNARTPTKSSSAGEGTDFQVGKLEMVADSCTLKRPKGPNTSPKP